MKETSIQHRRLDFSLHISRFDGKKGERYASGFDRTEFPLESFAQLATKFCWSPIVWRGGIRKSANFLLSQLVALDFDSPDYSLDQAVRDWCDTVHVIGTTHSHQVAKDGVICDRFRIVSVWDEPILDPNLYKPSLTMLTKENRADKCDKKCTDLARFFYPCREIISIETEGYLIESVKTLPPKNQKGPLRKLSGLPASALKYLSCGAPAGERNWSSYKFAFDCARVGYQEAEVIDWIRRSKTYQSETDPKVIEWEIPSTVRSAFKKWESMHG
ncbi:MAG: hypothetical protein VKL39_13715 [Leptolyngbyaceae bacterium]|nr:hypothetical protein [Leptolyngbyaceae bacterium]